MQPTKACRGSPWIAILAGGLFLLAWASWPAWAAPDLGERRLTTGGDALFLGWADAETLVFARAGPSAPAGGSPLWTVSLRTGRVAQAQEG
ncbi:MAG: hypothetical protein ACUVST_10060, partial [Anaerolineae bacterium]